MQALKKQRKFSNRNYTRTTQAAPAAEAHYNRETFQFNKQSRHAAGHGTERHISIASLTTIAHHLNTRPRATTHLANVLEHPLVPLAVAERSVHPHVLSLRHSRLPRARSHDREREGGGEGQHVGDKNKGNKTVRTCHKTRASARETRKPKARLTHNVTAIAGDTRHCTTTVSTAQ